LPLCAALPAGHQWQGRWPPFPLPLPLPLSLCPYLRLSPSSRSPLCTRITPSCTRAPHTASAAAPVSAAAGGARRR
jgi:hypothetical protein